MRVLRFIFSHCILPLVLSYQISSLTLPKLLAPKDSRFICSLSFSFIPSRRLLNIWFPILSLFVREITIPIHINYSITLIYFRTLLFLLPFSASIATCFLYLFSPASLLFLLLLFRQLFSLAYANYIQFLHAYTVPDIVIIHLSYSLSVK